MKKIKGKNDGPRVRSEHYDIGRRKNVPRRNVVAEIKRGDHSGVHVVEVRESEYFRENPRSQHVIHDNGKWSVVKSGSSRATVTCATKGEAVKKAREIAKKLKTEMYVHGSDGRIRQRDSYGSDPFPRKG